MHCTKVMIYFLICSIPSTAIIFPSSNNRCNISVRSSLSIGSCLSRPAGVRDSRDNIPHTFCTKRFPVRLFRSSRFAAQADAGVALSAVMFVSFPEVVQQHTAAAYGVVGHVVEHGIDARFIACFPVFVYFRRDMDAL